MLDWLRRRPLLAITALAALLRLPTLGLESLWYDEAFTAWLANLPIGNLWAATLGDVHPPTWYLIEWAVSHSIGTGEFSLRLVSALAGVALVPAVWRLSGHFHATRNTQHTAALVTALAPFTIYYSQEARPYSLLMLATTLATVGLLERKWWLLVLAGSFSLYLHNLAVLYVAALVWLGIFRWRLEWRMLGSFGLIGMIWLPWLIWGLLHQVSDVQSGFWVRPPNPGTPAYILNALLFSESAAFLAINAGMLSGLLLLLAWQDIKRQVELTGLVVVCLGLACILSVLITPVLIVRVMAPLAPVLYSLVAPVLARSRLIAALALVTVATWLGAYWLSDQVGRSSALQGLESFQLEPGDGIYHGNLSSYITMRYYLPDVPQVVWKQAGDLSQSLTEPTKAAMGMEQTTFEAVKCQRPRWWIITASNPTTSPAERAYLNDLLARNHGEQHAVIKQTGLVDARLWLVDTRAACNVAEAAR
ncbi:MAG: hypothetical protein BroJett011_61970 [Chloroflexota bacterium]|nr:MAG: hypothetical protein BroJett011_61970 [Chloroflexota bacterium]